jgi:quercetin dioxygenase-like cupin family protein
MSLEMRAGVVDGASYETIRYPSDEIMLRVTDHGAVQVTEYVSQDREGGPVHAHEWDEIEYVIEGEAEFWINDAWTRGGPGTVQMLPAGTAHNVRIPEGTARLLMVTIGTPYDGFARDVAALYERGEPATDDIIATAARHGVRLG